MKAVTMEVIHSASTALVLYILPPVTIALSILITHLCRRPPRRRVIRAIRLCSRIVISSYLLGLAAGVVLLGIRVGIMVKGGPATMLSDLDDGTVLVLATVYMILFTSGLRVVISASRDRIRKDSERVSYDHSTPLRTVCNGSMSGIDPIVD